MSTDPQMPRQDAPTEGEGHDNADEDRESLEATDAGEPVDTLTFDDADSEFRQKSNEIAQRFREALDRLA